MYELAEIAIEGDEDRALSDGDHKNLPVRHAWAVVRDRSHAMTCRTEVANTGVRHVLVRNEVHQEAAGRVYRPPSLRHSAAYAKTARRASTVRRG